MTAVSSAIPQRHVMRTVDEIVVHCPVERIFALASAVEEWPRHLAHYRYVRMRERGEGEIGIVEMSAYRPFGPLNWPTWWASKMVIDVERPAILFRHVEGITTGMDVEWSFTPERNGTLVRIVHEWDGPPWPIIATLAARYVIGPIFVHGIASRTLTGLARAAEHHPAPMAP